MKWLYRLSEGNLKDYMKVVDLDISQFLKWRLVLCILLSASWCVLCGVFKEQYPILSSVFLYGLFCFLLLGFKIPYFYLKMMVKKKTQQVFTDFPLWLSSLEVLILSNNIPNTLKKSFMTCPVSIKKDLQILIGKIEQDPMNQQNYIDFLSQYKLADINELMLDLYQFNYLDKSLMISEFAVLHKRLNALNSSNRKRLHEQSLFFIGAINSIPLFLLSIYILLIANMLSNVLIGG